MPILMYHWFREPGTTSRSLSPQLEIEPRTFEEQLAWLARKGYRGVSLARVLECAEQGLPLPSRPVAITFDDGCADFARFAWPALKGFGLPATLFVVAGEVGGSNRWDRSRGEPERPLLGWEELRRLTGEGLEIGSHTLTHPDLASLSEGEALQEMRGSRALLEERLGRAVEFLAYPFGSFTEQTERLARRAGYRAACAVLLSAGDLARSARFRLRRLTVKGGDRGMRFRARLRAARSTVHRIERPGGRQGGRQGGGTA